jgi:hypothetical protein
LIRAERPGALDLTVCATQPDGSLDAEVRLERIASSELEKTDAAATETARPAVTSPELELLAHVARRGDVTAQRGEWICGPDSPAAIEGLEVRWPNKPADVELHYTLTVGQDHRQRLMEKTSGQFAGTRGKALPIVGITLALSGAAAAAYELCGDALFENSPVMSKSGLEIAFSGPTGREPLVGLRLGLATRKDPKLVAEADNKQAVAVKQIGRVRVYRPGAVPPPRGKNIRAS